MKLDKAIKGTFVKCMLPLLRNRKILNLVPRELVQFAFYQKGYHEFQPDNQLLAPTAISNNPLRYAMIALAIQRIHKDNVPGAFAELGVFRGETGEVINRLSRGRPFYLFDTFSGFAAADEPNQDDRFRDTSVDLVRQRLGNSSNLNFRVGYFPETAAGLEHERFAFVMLDMDKFKPTAAALEFFYPRLSPGGYLFAHDYNSSESDWAVSKAVDAFLRDKPEKLVEMPDIGGSILFRKC